MPYIFFIKHILLPYLISFIPGHSELAGNARPRLTKMTFHALSPARSQADLLSYLGLNITIPKYLLDRQEERRRTTTENLTLPAHEYTAPDYFVKQDYSDDEDKADEAPKSAPETGGWWPE